MWMLKLLSIYVHLIFILFALFVRTPSVIVICKYILCVSMLCYVMLLGTIPPQLGSLRQLNHLQLGGNLFHGTIPTAFSALKKLNYFQLSDNQLSGSIPSEIGTMRNLGNMYLENNTLTGEIPESLGCLSVLVELHLDALPGLTGVIPESLCDISTLTQLTVSDNIICYPTCLSSVPTTAGYTNIFTCPTPSEVALCDFIAATSVGAVVGMSQWSCTPRGYPTTPPCDPNLSDDTVAGIWANLDCIGGTSNVNRLHLSGLGIQGKCHAGVHVYHVC